MLESLERAVMGLFYKDPLSELKDLSEHPSRDGVAIRAYNNCEVVVGFQQPDGTWISGTIKNGD